MKILVVQTPDRRVLVFTRSGYKQPATEFDNPVAAEEFLSRYGWQCVSDQCREINPIQRRHPGFRMELDYISGVYHLGDGGAAACLAILSER